MKKLLFTFPVLFLCVSCSRTPVLTSGEFDEKLAEIQSYYDSVTITKPYEGQEYVPGKTGGEWNTTIGGDPKSFNLLIAERDNETSGILAPLTDALVDYDLVQKKWVPRLASFKVVPDYTNNRLDVIYTLRNDLYWSFIDGLHPRVKITADDVVFWYNEINCDEEMGSSSYNAQFIDMDDGSTGLVTIEKLSELSFAFHFPCMNADPLLATNMSFGPAFIYKKAKDEGGADRVKNILTVDSDPREIPSCGPYFIAKYEPGQKIVYERNPDYWEKDSKGQSICYPQRRIAQIVGDDNLRDLLFRDGKIETYSPSPERINDVIADSQKYGYTVFNAKGSLSAPMWTFNQNPQNSKEQYYKWFTKKEFRQAMSCLLNRDRICRIVYRGLAEPKYSFFPEPNQFYNEKISLRYRYDRAQAQKLLEGAGFVRKDDGFLYDEEGIRVEFDLTIASSNTSYSDIAQIIAGECKKAGITVNVRQTDFQALVEQLTTTYDWQSVLIGLGGSNIFPTQGSNVWVTSGNLHMWYPLQKSPATQWEARVDYLYNKAKSIVDVEKARPLWEEYQEILLEQCPVIFLVRGKNFFSINNRWDFSNVYFDNMHGAMTERAFLKEL